MIIKIFMWGMVVFSLYCFLKAMKIDNNERKEWEILIGQYDEELNRKNHTFLAGKGGMGGDE